MGKRQLKVGSRHVKPHEHYSCGGEQHSKKNISSTFDTVEPS